MSATQTLSYEASIPRTTLHRLVVDGVEVFYRAAGPVDAPVLLLHGFPTSSPMIRELIPRLATRYNTRHFALDTHVDEIASSIQRFLAPVRY